MPGPPGLVGKRYCRVPNDLPLFAMREALAGHETLAPTWRLEDLDTTVVRFADPKRG
jgi:hypothetical protein